MAADWDGDGAIGGDARGDRTRSRLAGRLHHLQPPPGLPTCQTRRPVSFATHIGAEVNEPWANPEHQPSPGLHRWGDPIDAHRRRRRATPSPDGRARCWASSTAGTTSSTPTTAKTAVFASLRDHAGRAVLAASSTASTAPSSPINGDSSAASVDAVADHQAGRQLRDHPGLRLRQRERSPHRRPRRQWNAAVGHPRVRHRRRARRCRSASRSAASTSTTRTARASRHPRRRRLRQLPERLGSHRHVQGGARRGLMFRTEYRYDKSAATRLFNEAPRRRATTRRTTSTRVAAELSYVFWRRP